MRATVMFSAAFAAEVLPGVFSLAATGSQCWSGQFSVSNCCILGQDQSCWAPPFDEQFCCYSSPTLLSNAELSVMKNSIQEDGSSNLDLSCGCRPARDDAGQTFPSYDEQRDERFWCRALKTIGYQHDDGMLLQEFLNLGTNTLAECPIGAAALSFRIGHRKAQAMGANVFETPAYFYASEIFDFLFEHSPLEDIFSSGWPLFHQMSFIREYYFQHESNAVANDPSLDEEQKKWFATITKVLGQEGESVVPIDFKQTAAIYMQGSNSLRSRAMAALAMAENLLAVDDLDRAEVIGNQYIMHAHRILKRIVKEEATTPSALFTTGSRLFD